MSLIFHIVFFILHFFCVRPFIIILIRLVLTCPARRLAPAFVAPAFCVQRKPLRDSAEWASSAETMGVNSLAETIPDEMGAHSCSAGPWHRPHGRRAS